MRRWMLSGCKINANNRAIKHRNSGHYLNHHLKLQTICDESIRLKMLSRPLRSITTISWGSNWSTNAVDWVAKRTLAYEETLYNRPATTVIASGRSPNFGSSIKFASRTCPHTLLLQQVLLSGPPGDCLALCRHWSYPNCRCSGMQVRSMFFPARTNIPGDPTQ